MSEGRSIAATEAELALLSQSAAIRPALHRYCARILGSVIEGEEVVQDTLMRALSARDLPPTAEQLRPWLFRVAHNRALDVLRSQAVRAHEPLEAVRDLDDDAVLDPAQALIRQRALATAVSRFVELPLPQRSAVILKDVLDESLAEIAALLELSVDAVKAHLARGRGRLRALREGGEAVPEPGPISSEVARYIALFNRHDWDGLRALLAHDVKLRQSDYPLREGPAEVGTFFGIYGELEGIRLRPAWLGEREVIAVFESGTQVEPSYFMWLRWREGQITFIRDYRYLRYVVAGAELRLA